MSQDHYYIERKVAELGEQANWIKKKLEDVEKKLDSLIAFKWQIIGGSGVISFICVIVLELLKSLHG